MLSPEYLLRVSEGGEEIAESLHNEIIKKMVERISARLDRGDDYILTAYDKWQIEVLQDAGYLREDIEKELARHTGLMQNKIAEAMVDAGVKSLESDAEVYRAAGLSPAPLEQSPHLARLMQRNYEATMGEWLNFTRTTADACQQSFIKACDTAYTMVFSGAVGYSEAFRDAINTIIESGATVTYPSGHTDTIETATLRCIRTGVSQATAQITDARMDEMDWDIILVSSHLDARVTDRNDFTNHYWWQGKFYSKSGKDARFPPFSICGEGNVQGIHGANCRHSHGPGDGEFNPYEQYDSEENRKEYELQQRQRLMERRIRENKRECIGLKQGIDSAKTDASKALLQKDYDKASAKLQKRNEAYNQFCKENDLKKLNERITIAQWDRQQAAQARVAAQKEGKASREESKRKYDSTAISPSVKTSEYRKLYNNLDEPAKMQRIAHNAARNMLVHRDGTKYEDLAYINSQTGEIMVRNDYNVENEVVPSKRMMRMIARSPDNSIIAIHNHPGSTVPSITDINTAYKRKYKYGIIACHNGTVMKYAVNGPYNSLIVQFLLDTVQNNLYNGGEKMQRALRQLGEQNIVLEVFK